jgi:hypothetical protein
MWVLIVVVISAGAPGGGTSTSISSIPGFTSEASCIAAANTIRKSGQVGAHNYSIMAACAHQ